MLKTLLWCLMGAATLAAGCDKPRQESSRGSAPVATSRAAVKLAVLVVDDSNLATGINLLRGEWAARSGGELVVSEQTAEELFDAERLPFDLVVFPSQYLGALVELHWLRPVRDSIFQDTAFDFQDILPLIRNRTMRYRGQVYALSLGESPLMFAWRGKAPVKLQHDRSNTWSQMDQLRPRRSKSAVLGYPSATELLVRAVGYSNQRGDAPLFFDPRTMQPRLLEPPFVRALQELMALGPLLESGSRDSQVELSWPTAYPKGTGNQPPLARSFTMIPRSSEVYVRTLQTWRSNGDEKAPTVLGFAGRLVGVSRSSRNATSAFKLLKWIASGNTAAQLSQRSNATLWFRKSQSSRSQEWLARRGVADGVEAVVTKLLSADKCFLLPRIPGIDDYLKSLDEAVEQAVAGVASAEEALGRARTKWEAITEQYGKGRQRDAYRRHLGLEELSE